MTGYFFHLEINHVIRRYDCQTDMKWTYNDYSYLLITSSRINKNENNCGEKVLEILRKRERRL